MVKTRAAKIVRTLGNIHIVFQLTQTSIIILAANSNAL